MKTYRDIILAFTDFFEKHRVIKTFIDTQTWNFQTESREFPAVICVPNISSGNYQQINLSISLFFCDILMDSADNTKDVYNDMLECIKDFVGYFADSNDWFAELDYQISPFEEKFDERVAGWQLDFTINLPIEHCDYNI